MSDDKGTTVMIEVGIPDAAELQRIVDTWYDAQPLSMAYACFAGDQEAEDELGSSASPNLDPEEQDRVLNTAVRYLWLAAARKRVSRP